MADRAGLRSFNHNGHDGHNGRHVTSHALETSDGLDEAPLAFDTVSGSVLTPNTWTKRTSAITPNASIDRILVEPYDVGSFAGTVNWHIDDGFYPGEEIDVARGMFNGWTGLSNSLKAITGAPGGYWNDFSAAVFENLVQASDSQEMPDVYLCIPFAGDQERYEDQENRSLTCIWRQTIWAFVRDTKQHPTSTGTIELVSKIRDDLVRRILLDPTLGGTVQEIRLLEGFRIGGAEAHDGYGYLELDVEIEQIIGAADLGPDA